MVNQRLRASKAMSLPSADDFKRICGIGPAIRSRLYNAGINTFAQLAALTPDEIAARIAGLSAKRVAKEGWIRQARKLVPKRAQDKSHKKAKVVSRQHYANYTIEFLLSENDEARRTRIVHVQSGDTETWAGWEAERLIDFLARHTIAHSHGAKSMPRITSMPKMIPSTTVATQLGPEPDVEVRSQFMQPATTNTPVPTITSIDESDTQFVPFVDSVPPASVVARNTDPSTPQVGLAGALRLLNLEVVPIRTNKPQSIVPHGEAFEVRLSINLTEVEVGSDPRPRIHYAVSIYAKNIGGGSYQTIGEAHDIVAFADRITIIAGIHTLPPGLYRLEAAATLWPAITTAQQLSSLKAWLEGGLLQVY